jgi:formylglycine-generating enzyme required for sulfatase activity
MAHDVFISYSIQDQAIAEAVCTGLESQGLRCWIAPRDVPAGAKYQLAILDAIDKSRAMVLVLSSGANASLNVESEVDRAVHRRVPIIPFRIEAVLYSETLDRYLGSIHWLDALTPPLEAHIQSLAETLHRLPVGQDNAAAAPRTIINALGMRLALIPAGEFDMGSPDSDKEAEDDEKPQHRVRITRPFYLGVTEMTQGQYLAVTGQNPSCFQGSDDLPVEQVSWYDAVAFCNALSTSEGLSPYYQLLAESVEIPDRKEPGYRLPTEAEWEYACRAGNPSRVGDEGRLLDRCAWYADNSGRTTHPVGQKCANGFGLYDMHGNVWEWCWDRYAEDYYKEAPGADPAGPSETSVRVIRGESWSGPRRDARSAHRGWSAPHSRDFCLGFRVARGQSSR